MNIVHFCHSFSILTETFIYDYITELERQGQDNHILTLNRVNEKDRPFEKVELIKLPLWNIPRMWNIGRALATGGNRETAAWDLYRKKIRARLEQLKPDIVHAHYGPAGVLLHPITKALDIPLAVTFYGYDISEYRKDPFWVEQYQTLGPRVSMATVLSSLMKEEAVKIGFTEEGVHVLHLGIKTEVFSFTSPQGDIRNLLSVGRLAGKKGHLDSIKALERVRKKTGLPLSLKIIGEGDHRTQLENYINQKNLQDCVSLLGAKNHQEIADEMRKADAFILSSKTASNGDREGTPTVLMEAQACGLPCISTWHSGIPEVIPQANHRFLAPEGDVKAIAHCIEKLLQCPPEEQKKIAALGREKVEKEFNIKTEVQKLANLYQAAVQSSSHK